MHASDCGPSCPTCNCPRLAPSPATLPRPPPAPSSAGPCLCVRRPGHAQSGCLNPASSRRFTLLSPLLLHFFPPPPGAAEDVAKLDSGVSWARALDGSEYMPGLVGLNNLKLTDYANVVVQALIRVHPIR